MGSVENRKALLTAQKKFAMISFQGRHFPKNLILMAVRWKLAYPLSYRAIDFMLSETREQPCCIEVFQKSDRFQWTSSKGQY